MKLVGYLEDGVRHIGLVEGDNVRDLGSARKFYDDVDAALANTSGAVRPLAGLKLTPAIPETSRIFCVGINYRSHAGESKDLAGLDEPKVPMIFGRWEQSLIVDGEAAPVPPNEEGLDWEVELAAVISKEVWLANRDNALDAVLGYATFNDLSARDKQLATAQFTLGKNPDRSGPFGPVITKDEVGDPADGLRVTTKVNGETMQDGNTRDLIHDLPAIITYITDTVTLLPGDVIATGTPGGVGAGRTPKIFLKPGDEVVVEVEKLGAVRTPIVSH